MNVDWAPAMLDELTSGLREQETFSEGASLYNRYSEEGQNQQRNGNELAGLFHFTFPPRLLYVTMKPA